jgi:hypothetical protein
VNWIVVVMVGVNWNGVVFMRVKGIRVLLMGVNWIVGVNWIGVCLCE